MLRVLAAASVAGLVLFAPSGARASHGSDVASCHAVPASLNFSNLPATEAELLRQEVRELRRDTDKMCAVLREVGIEARDAARSDSEKLAAKLDSLTGRVDAAATGAAGDSAKVLDQLKVPTVLAADNKTRPLFVSNVDPAGEEEVSDVVRLSAADRAATDSIRWGVMFTAGVLMVGLLIAPSVKRFWP